LSKKRNGAARRGEDTHLYFTLMGRRRSRTDLSARTVFIKIINRKNVPQGKPIAENTNKRVARNDGGAGTL